MDSHRILYSSYNYIRTLYRIILVFWLFYIYRSQRICYPFMGTGLWLVFSGHSFGDEFYCVEDTDNRPLNLDWLFGQHFGYIRVKAPAAIGSISFFGNSGGLWREKTGEGKEFVLVKAKGFGNPAQDMGGREALVSLDTSQVRGRYSRSSGQLLQRQRNGNSLLLYYSAQVTVHSWHGSTPSFVSTIVIRQMANVNIPDSGPFVHI